jgi:hypothetical protein
VIALPLALGVVQLTLACTLPAVAVTLVGASGTPAGVTTFDAADAGPVPTALVAVTINAYDVPLFSAITVHGEPGQGWLPAAQITVYPVIALPFAFGEVQLTVAESAPAPADTATGASGGPIGVTLLDGDEGGPVPNALVAVTVKV